MYVYALSYFIHIHYSIKGRQKTQQPAAILNRMLTFAFFLSIEKGHMMISCTLSVSMAYSFGCK